MTALSQQYTGKPPESAYETLKTITFVIIAAIIVRTFIAQPFLVQGSSMEPNFHNADYLVVDKIRYRLGDPKRGEVIVFVSPEDSSQNYIKRVIGLPGDKVTIRDGEVLINDQKINEDYILEPVSVNPTSDPDFFLEQKLGNDEYFVMGDNRDHSSDSRRWGPLDKDKIIGRALVIVFPFSDFGTVDNPIES
ncbi:signal peptidase I [Candidatus Berkelbacteria bacterium]|nr:signal peptidase I [Candidatus Berkelbacteria bacterium]